MVSRVEPGTSPFDVAQGGKVIAFPTESFFAFGVPANDSVAIRQLFHIKKREPWKPIALIAADVAQVKKFFFMNDEELALAKRFWPGPLTLLLQPKSSINAKALGAKKIGVRVPSHAGARALAKKLGAPITATSANRSGEPPTKSRRALKREFPDILIVPGRCGRQSQPSTIIDVRGTELHIIRQGSVHV